MKEDDILIKESSETIIIHNGHTKWLCDIPRDPKKMSPCKKMMLACHGIRGMIHRLSSIEIKTRKNGITRKLDN